jgi:hypothetical protein
LKSILLVVAFFALALMVYRRIGSLDVTEGRGNRIVLALENYRGDHKQYPATLAELCPMYLASIPAPAWGLRAWRYQRIPDGAFYLTVNEDENTGDGNSLWFAYLGPKHGWQTGD